MHVRSDGKKDLFRETDLVDNSPEVVGEAFLRMGFIQRALQTFSVVLRADPGNSRARSLFGLALELDGQSDSAFVCVGVCGVCVRARCLPPSGWLVRT